MAGSRRRPQLIFCVPVTPFGELKTVLILSLSKDEGLAQSWKAHATHHNRL